MPIRKPLLRRAIMQEYAIPQPKGRRITDLSQLLKFRKDINATIGVAPVQAALSRTGQTLLSPHNSIEVELLRGKRTWVAQAHLNGLRFKAISTVHGCLAILSTDHHASVDTAVLEKVSVIATQAIRATPQLPWAVVEIFIEASTKRILVEDICLNPRITPGTRVVSGSMDDALCEIIAQASNTD